MLPSSLDDRLRPVSHNAFRIVFGLMGLAAVLEFFGGSFSVDGLLALRRALPASRR